MSIEKAIEIALDGWITIHYGEEKEDGKQGYRRLFIRGGETPKEAMKRAWGVDLDKKGKADKKSIKDKSKKEDDNAQKKETARQKSDRLSKQIYDLKSRMEQKAKEYNEAVKNTQKEIAEYSHTGNFDKYKEFSNKRSKIRDEYEEIKKEYDSYQQNVLNSLSEDMEKNLKEYSSKTDSLVADIEKFDYKKENLEKIIKDIDAHLNEKRGKPLYWNDEDYLKLVSERTQYNKEINEESKKIALDVSDLLRKNNKTNFSVNFKSASMKDVGENLKTHLNGVIGDDLLQSTDVVNIKKLRDNCRAFQKGDSINLTKSEKIGTQIHEYMHFIEEKNPRILMNSLAFAKMRTKDDETESLSRITGKKYRSWEKSKKDNFFNPYCGKVYSEDGSFGKAYASEIMSMGVQKLFEDPKGFAKQDRQYFNFVIANLRGDI